MSGSFEKAKKSGADAETGGRDLEGITLKIVLCIAFSWSVFQLYAASAIPFFKRTNWSQTCF